MTEQTVSTIAVERPEVSSTFLQISVLAALASTGALATNILLPSLPQMAASLNVSTAAVTSAITIFFVVFALGQLVVGPISDHYGRRWPVLTGFAVFFGSISWPRAPAANPSAAWRKSTTPCRATAAALEAQTRST